MICRKCKKHEKVSGTGAPRWALLNCYKCTQYIIRKWIRKAKKNKNWPRVRKELGC